MKKSILILLAAAIPALAQGPAPVAPVAPAAPAPVAAAPVDANNDGVINPAEAMAAKKAFIMANADKFAKKPEGRRHGKRGMKHEGRRHGKPGMNKGFRPEAPKAGKFEGRKPGMNKGFRPQAPKFNGCRCGKKHAPGVQPRMIDLKKAA